MNSWTITELSWDGDHTPAPNLLRVSDGSALLYPGLSHTIFAPAGSGKSWLATLLAAQRLGCTCGREWVEYDHIYYDDDVETITKIGQRVKSGLIPESEVTIDTLPRLIEQYRESTVHHTGSYIHQEGCLDRHTDPRVLYIDFEASWPVIRDRLLAAGVEPGDFNLSYIHPHEKPTAEALREVIDWAAGATVVIDGITSAYAIMGLDDNSARDTRLLYQALIEPFETVGATVLCIDHTAKADGSTPLGSGQKTATVTGAEYALHVKKAPSKRTDTSPGQIGRLELVVSKDRHGSRAKGDVAAVFTIDGVTNPGRVDLALDPPKPAEATTGPRDPEHDPVLMSKLYRFVLDNPNMTTNAVAEQAGGRKAANLAALHSLTERGVIDRTENESRKGSYRLTARPLPEGVSIFNADLRYVPEVTNDAEK